MMNSTNPNNLLVMTKVVKKGERIYPSSKNLPVAVAEVNFRSGDIGVIDYCVTYPVMHKRSMLLLPGLKKNNSLKMEPKCKKHKKKE